MVGLLKERISFVNMHEISTKNQYAIIKITKENQEILSEIKHTIIIINQKIDKIEKKLGTVM